MTSVDLFEKESFFDALKKSVSKHLQINRILLIVYAVLSGFLFLGALRPAAEGSGANSGITLFVWLFSLIFSARVFFKPEALPETDAPHAVVFWCTAISEFIIIGVPMLAVVLTALCSSLIAGTLTAAIFLRYLAMIPTLCAYVFLERLTSLYSKTVARFVWRLIAAPAFIAAVQSGLTEITRLMFFGMPKEETDLPGAVISVVFMTLTAAALALMMRFESRRIDSVTLRLGDFFIVAMNGVFIGLLCGTIAGATNFFAFPIGFIIGGGVAALICHTIIFRALGKPMLISLAVLGGFCVLSIAYILIVNAASASYVNYIPALEDIESAGYIHYEGAFDDMYSYKDAVGSADDFSSANDIKAIIATHKELLKANEPLSIEKKLRANYSEGRDLHFFGGTSSKKYSVSYRLKNGGTVVRYYRTEKYDIELPAQYLENKNDYQLKYSILSDIKISEVTYVGVRYGLFTDHETEDPDKIKQIVEALKADVKRSGKSDDGEFTVYFRYYKRSYYFSVPQGYTETRRVLDSYGYLRKR